MQNPSKVKRSGQHEPENAENGMQFREGEGADTQLERATAALRDLVLRGAFPVDEKLPEMKVAELLGVSRTPARLAMAALEQDGLLVRLPRRGFRIKSFSLDEVVEAIEVRGEVEAIAARLAAERGLPAEFRVRMEGCIGRSEILLRNTLFEAAQRREWCQMNVDFHDALVQACRVRPLWAAYRQVNLVPLASPRDIMFNMARPQLSHRQLEATHQDHARILDAIQARQSTRAAALVREHAFRSGENKRRNFRDLDRTIVLDTPGAPLIRASEGQEG